jgi:hypothetical protein
MKRGQRREKTVTGVRFPTRAALRGVVVDVLGVSGNDREVGGDRNGEANPRAWSASSITSRYDDEVRLERKEASGVAGVLDLLCNRTITMNQKVRQGDRREMVQKKGRRVLHCTGIRRRFACSSEDSGEKFRQPGGDLEGKGRGRRQRRSRAICR